MIRTVIAATAILGGITVLLAQSDQITERQALMKSNAKNAKGVNMMVKGEAPFDAAQAKAAFNTWHENAKKIPTLFTSPPPGDAKTRALPKIWENKADFFDAKAITIPFAISVFPDELYQAPRSWAERAYPDNLIHYNRLDRGGHFAAWEPPQLFAEELRAAFTSLR